MKSEHNPTLCFAMNDVIVTLHQANLYIGLADIRTKTIFSVIEKVAVYIVIEPDFINRYVPRVYRTDRKLNPMRSGQKAILFHEIIDHTGRGRHIMAEVRRQL